MFNYIKFDLFLMSSLEKNVGWGEMKNVDTKTKPETLDLSHLSDEQREEYESLKKKFESIKSWKKFVWDYANNLETRLLKDWDLKDREYWEVVTRIERLQKELKSLWEQSSKVQAELSKFLWWFKAEIRKISPEETSMLKTIDNSKFLETPMEKRLQYITKNWVDSSEVSNWSVKDVEFTFTFDGQFNRELYLKTTAGQVLPKEVWSVIVNWREYNRINNSTLWEFYDASNNRLEIHERTKLEVSKLRSTEDLAKIENWLAEVLKGKDKPLDKMIAEVAYNKWVNEKLLTSIAKEHLDIAWLDLWDFDEQDKQSIQKLFENQDYIKRELELYATDISRYLSWAKNLDKDNYSIEFVADIFRERNPAWWENKLVEYGFTAEQVSEYNKNNYRVEAWWLWSLSASEESWNRWPEAINLNDTKWPAYGTYQLCQQALLDFAKQNWISWTPWTTEFTANWTAKINELWRANFQKFEHEFIKKTHFDVQMDKIASNAWVDVTKFSLTLKNVVWSTSVQHWANTDIIIKSINDVWTKDFSSLDAQEKLINKIYENRENAYPAWKDRYKRELDKALTYLKNSLPWEINLWWVLSSPAERSESGTTLCSKTARLNLTNIWISAPQWSSAKASFDMYDSSRITKTFDNNAKVADIFLDASPKNREHWHRAVAINNWWSWYVLDPYLPIWWNPPTRQPIPLETYMNHIQSRWREFWWAVMYS